MIKLSPTSTSVRRYFVDRFFFDNRDKITGTVLDIGGKKAKKRGTFDIAKFAKIVTYVNIDKGTEPDIVSDASSIPLSDSSCDTVILGEVLEHVRSPELVLKESARLLKPGGNILITVPFMYPVHADPFDYGRYTEHFWREAASDCELNVLSLKSQGTIFAILAQIVQHLFISRDISWRPIQFPLIKFLMWLDKKTKNTLLCSWTTGYGIILQKS